MKIAPITNVMEINEVVISLIASSAAILVLFAPFSNLAWTASTTTIASSTTIPIASTNANNVSKLIEYPNKFRKKNVPTIETGTAMAGINVEHHQEHQNKGFYQCTDYTADGCR